MNTGVALLDNELSVLLVPFLNTYVFTEVSVTKNRKYHDVFFTIKKKSINPFWINALNELTSYIFTFKSNSSSFYFFLDIFICIECRAFFVVSFHFYWTNSLCRFNC